MTNQLRWISVAVTTAVAALAMGQSSAQTYVNTGYGYGSDYGHSRILRCESTNSRQAWCRVDTRGGVRIARQISHSACVEGRTWGSSDRGVWVSNGCRADFAIGSGRDDRHHDGRDVSISYSDRTGYGVGTGYSTGYSGHAGYGVGTDYSTGYRTGYSGRSVYGAGTGYGTGYSDRSAYGAGTGYGTGYSGRAAYGAGSGYTDAYGDRGAYDAGIGYGTGNSYNYSNSYGNSDSRYADSFGQVVQCDSTGGGRTYCHTEPNHQFLLSRSRAGNCVEGQTWGTDDRGLWVSGDCRGDFNYRR
jgi:hypothetical protein